MTATTITATAMTATPLDDDRHPSRPPADRTDGGLLVNGTRIEVPHMHFFRYDADGRLTDLWNVWNTLMLARQLAAPAPDLSISVLA